MNSDFRYFTTLRLVDGLHLMHFQETTPIVSILALPSPGNIEPGFIHRNLLYCSVVINYLNAGKLIRLLKNHDDENMGAMSYLV